MPRKSDVKKAAAALVAAYDKEKPVRTAYFHRSGCGCMRCVVDALRGLIVDD